MASLMQGMFKMHFLSVVPIYSFKVCTRIVWESKIKFFDLAFWALQVKFFIRWTFDKVKTQLVSLTNYKLLTSSDRSFLFQNPLSNPWYYWIGFKMRGQAVCQECQSSFTVMSGTITLHQLAPIHQIHNWSLHDSNTIHEKNLSTKN